MRNDPIEAELAGLDGIPVRSPEGKARFVKALAAKSNLVVAKAARLIGNAQWGELDSELAAAFERTMAKGPAGDKGCAATIAIARALVALDYNEPEIFLRGMRHVQMEGSYGPPVDAAAELREVCAMGLANSGYPQKLRELLPLLADRESRVRAGAIRAVAVAGSEAAALLLRFKMLTGDAEAEVMADCFGAALSLEDAAGVAEVGRFARSAGPEIREAAVLALGASRRADAIEWLIAEFAETADAEGRGNILLSLATSRTEAAMEFLLELVREGSASTSACAASALGIHARDELLRARVEEAMRSREG